MPTDPLDLNAITARAAAARPTRKWLDRYVGGQAVVASLDDVPALVEELAVARTRLAAVHAISHEDWCCAKGCAGEGFCIGCAGTEADCKCIVVTIRAALGGAVPDGSDGVVERVAEALHDLEYPVYNPTAVRDHSPDRAAVLVAAAREWRELARDLDPKLRKKGGIFL